MGEGELKMSKSEINVEVESYLGTRWLYETCKAEVLKENKEALIVNITEGFSKGKAIAVKRENDIPIVPYDLKEPYIIINEFV